MRYNDKHISPNLSSRYGYETGMEAGENMSYGWSGEVKQNQLTRVVGAMHDETFLMMIGKGARQTGDIQTMCLVHTKHQGENNTIGWMC